MMQIQSHSHPYTVVECPDVRAALESLGQTQRRTSWWTTRWPISTACSWRAFRRSGCIGSWPRKRRSRTSRWVRLVLAVGSAVPTRITTGGDRSGVLQDIGVSWRRSCFAASAGRWCRHVAGPVRQLHRKQELAEHPAIQESVGTFYPPHEIRLAFDFLNPVVGGDLGGLGEAIKLH